MEPTEEQTSNAGIRDLGAAYRTRSTTPTESTRKCLERIQKLNPTLNAFITVLGDSALKTAAESEKRFKEVVPLGPLDGVPIAVKDLIYIKGVRSTAGSQILAHNIAAYDAPVVKRLKAAGAVIIGTTNLHEFAAGSTGVNPHYGPIRNPWDAERMSGGSSGGSAVAVATGMAAGTIGTDTGGSIRIPAALSGVVGLKPTYGLLSRLGVVPLSSSLDTVGIISRNAWDAAALLQVMAVRDMEDMTTVNTPIPDYVASLTKAPSSNRIGVPRKFFHEILDPRVERNFEAFVSKLKSMGCSVEDMDIDGISEVNYRWIPIRRAEATAFHLKWLEESPELYGEDVRRLLELGKEVLAVDYINALNSRPSFIERFLASMTEFDLLVAPCTCIPAPKIDQSTVNIDGRELTVYNALNRLTIPFNYVGLPVISIPSGLVDGLPLGVQVVGKLFEEVTLLRFAHAYDMKFGPFPGPPV